MTRAKEPWAIVLAAGEGERVRALVERRLGRHVPKQYCTFVGTRSMLEHTLDRASRICPANRIVTVIARAHQPILPPHGALRSGIVVPQPANRDTAAGVFLPLAYVRAADPDATVAIFPSDHFVHPEEPFLKAVRDAMTAATELRRIVLLGAVPEHLELEYGWVTPGRDLTANPPFRTYTVDAFMEKPSAEQADAARRRGALWNTMVMAGTARTFWRLGLTYVPEVMVLLERLGHAIGTVREADVLNAIYETMPSRNFSRDLLQQAGQALAVMALDGVHWSDWGEPGRIERSIRRLGKVPAFALASGSRRGL